MSILHDEILPALIRIAGDALTCAGYGTDLDNRVRLRPMNAFAEEETPAIAIFGISTPRTKNYAGKQVSVRVSLAVLVSQQHKAINDERDAPEPWRLCWQIATALEDGLLKAFREDSPTAKFDGLSLEDIRETPDQADPFTARIDLPLIINLRIRDNHSL